MAEDEDATQDIAKKYDTQPTISTVLERLDQLRTEIRDFREDIEIRLDRIESMTNQTRAEMLTLRADFREFKSQLKEPA
ncbi:MAG TPA: hypothetical protein VGB17_17470 [Pyrinomonadaceae bacterium]